MRRRFRGCRGGAKSAIAAAILAALAGGCRTASPPVGSYDSLAVLAPGAGRSHEIRGWQQREQGGAREATAYAAGPQTAAGVERPGLEDQRVGDLRTSYDEFRAERRRSLARDVATWIQTEARSHYVDDGPVDHWATFEETLERNGDDCDGLELLTSHFLRELGFPEDEVFRAIVFRQTDGQHHMVTLWFEDREDPWVIDPTGAMTTGMPRMSEIPGWVPLRVFSESVAFTVRERPRVPTVTPR